MTTHNVSIRNMSRKDISTLAKIELDVLSGLSIDELEIYDFLKRSNSDGEFICKVALIDDEVVAYGIFEVEDDTITIHRMTTDSSHQNQGAASRLLTNICNDYYEKCSKISIYVRETNLNLLRFLKNRGFSAVPVSKDTRKHIYKGYFEDTNEDAYLMSRRIRSDGN